jgi:site-specific DNA-methyltransferase (adenine-specific)
LILASSNPDDIVLDPFIGSGTTAVCSEQLRRKWLGCDSNAQYLEWAKNRLELLKNKSIKQWIEFDRKNLIRRMSIR